MRQLIITPKSRQNSLFTVIETVNGEFKSQWEDQKPDEVVKLVESYVYGEPITKRQ